MTDEEKLKRMKKRPTLEDIVKPDMSEDAKVVFRVAMVRAKKEQDKLLKKAAMM